MEPLKNKTGDGSKFLLLGMGFLLSTLLFGLLGAIEYAFPGVWRDVFSFEKIRPLHVSSAVFWILTTAVGCVIYFFKDHNQGNIKNFFLVRIIFFVLGGAFVVILISYCFGVFGGREYWEFNPWMALPISVGWLLFIYFFISNLKTLKNQPVYVWMWFTGVLFFLFTYIESNLWLIPSIRNNLVKDMLIQWKSYGSLVGSWNLLIYGSSIYLMDKLHEEQKYSHSSLAFWIYFLGLFNLMFNWGHHIYTLPTEPYVRHISYFVSMTELLLFGRMIYHWKSSINTARKNFNIEAYRFIVAADWWVFLTLGLAIAMSIPAFNVFVHGTHVIVAHTMGATIGINSMLLLAYITFIFRSNQIGNTAIKRGFWLMNISLFVFWMVLIGVGVIKAYWQFTNPNFIYSEMIISLRPYFYIFLVSGAILIVGILLIVLPLFKRGLASNYK